MLCNSGAMRLTPGIRVRTSSRRQTLLALIGVRHHDRWFACAADRRPRSGPRRWPVLHAIHRMLEAGPDRLCAVLTDDIAVFGGLCCSVNW